ncbi:MAG: DUF3568 family protein [Phycisphaerales bacterium]|nr:MAG: DUF3568 family protein [Phycisphaerales bacterium]
MVSRRVVLALLLAGTMVSACGCVAAVVGAGAVGTVAYMKGDLESVEAEPVDKVYAATKDALNQFGYAITKDRKDTISAEIIARDSQDKKVTIKLSSAEGRTTKLSIRFGTFGNEARSRLVYDKIRENLRQ